MHEKTLTSQPISTPAKTKLSANGLTPCASGEALLPEHPEMTVNEIATRAGYSYRSHLGGSSVPVPVFPRYRQRN